MVDISNYSLFRYDNVYPFILTDIMSDRHNTSPLPPNKEV